MTTKFDATQPHLIAQTQGRAGHMTLNRPEALNALTWEMCHQIEAQLGRWEADDTIDLIIIDGAGDRAFCAGGDIAEMYRTATAGDFDYGRRFWTDEYRLNAKLGTSPKPIVSFLHGFTLGGGVGIGCHVPHRIVCETSRIALPEVQIGLVPDIGGTHLLAQAPGRVGEYLGITATRMEASDALWAGFADHYVPQSHWDDLKEALGAGDLSAIYDVAQSPPPSALAKQATDIDAAFGGETLDDILNVLNTAGTEFAARTLATLAKPSPLAMAAGIELVHRARIGRDLIQALEQEYRFTYRAAEQGDFVEGIRAAIIDKDKSPKWRHALGGAATAAATRMLMPLGANALNLTEPQT